MTYLSKHLSAGFMQPGPGLVSGCVQVFKDLEWGFCGKLRHFWKGCSRFDSKCTYYVTPEDDTRQNGCLQKTVTQLYTLYCVYWLYSITSIHFIQYHASFKVVVCSVVVCCVLLTIRMWWQTHTLRKNSYMGKESRAWRRFCSEE